MRHGHLVPIGGKCLGDGETDASVTACDQDRFSHAGIFSYPPISAVWSNRARRKSHSGWRSEARHRPSKHQVGTTGAPTEEDTMTAMAIETSAVMSTRLADGLLVRLSGELGTESLTDLRSTLLSPLPADCRDVVVDAGDVTAVEFDALAVVFAAWAWAEEQGARFLLSRTSEAFDAVLVDNGVAEDLPRLSELPSAPGAAVIPLQRVAVG